MPPGLFFTRMSCLGSKGFFITSKPILLSRDSTDRNGPVEFVCSCSASFFMCIFDLVIIITFHSTKLVRGLQLCHSQRFHVCTSWYKTKFVASATYLEVPG